MSQCLLVPLGCLWCQPVSWSALTLPPQSGSKLSLAVMKDSMRSILVQSLQNVICCAAVGCTQPKLWRQWPGQDTKFCPHNECLVRSICLTQRFCPPQTHPSTSLPSLPCMLIVSFTLALWPLYSYSSPTFCLNYMPRKLLEGKSFFFS